MSKSTMKKCIWLTVIILFIDLILFIVADKIKDSKWKPLEDNFIELSESYLDCYDNIDHYTVDGAGAIVYVKNFYWNSYSLQQKEQFCKDIQILIASSANASGYIEKGDVIGIWIMDEDRNKLKTYYLQR